MSLIHRFKEQLVRHLSGISNHNVCLVKFEATNDSSDFSFGVGLDLWNYYVEINETDEYNDNILNYAAKSSDVKESMESLKTAAEKFAFQVEKLEIQNMKCFVKLMRNSAIKIVLESISSSDYGKEDKQDKTVAIDVLENENSSITNFRVKTFAKVLRNILDLYSKYTLTHDSSSADYKVLLTTQSNNKKGDFESNITVLCSVVRDNNTQNRKISHQSAEEYLKKRSDDMHLIALHKYGVRIKSDEKFTKMRENLGASACKLDMIEVKHTNALALTYNPKQAFILYNSARIETLLRSFEDKVISGYYPPLPELNNIDLSLLTENEEWGLLKQMMLFPETIQNVIVDLQNGKIGFHLLYKYLHNLAIAFSNYYSKKKVLTENRPQLIPVLHAKIHLLKGVQSVFNKTLGLLEIDPVSFM